VGASEEFKPELGEVIIDIDRPNLLSNPFRNFSRAENIELFDDYLKADLQHNGMMSVELRRIAWLLFNDHDVILMCWCKPLSCHGDVVKREIEKIVDEMESR